MYGYDEFLGCGFLEGAIQWTLGRCFLWDFYGSDGEVILEFLI
jgi:hypothetical protein